VIERLCRDLPRMIHPHESGGLAPLGVR